MSKQSKEPPQFATSEHEHFRRTVDADKLDRQFARMRKSAQQQRIEKLEKQYADLSKKVEDIAAYRDISIHGNQSGPDLRPRSGNQSYDA